MPRLLLDTCAMIWISAEQPIAAIAAEAIAAAHDQGETLWISPISAWEIGGLVARGRLALSMAPRMWFQRASTQPGIALCVMETEILIDSSFLPGDPPRDPADRIVIATARALGLHVVTRDRLILAYAEAGHLEAIPC